jgi:hypothetical protein
MKECMKIFKGLGILFLLCILSSTMALSEDKTKAMDNQTSITNVTQVNVSENQKAITKYRIFTERFKCHFHNKYDTSKCQYKSDGHNKYDKREYQ